MNLEMEDFRKLVCSVRSTFKSCVSESGLLQMFIVRYGPSGDGINSIISNSHSFHTLFVTLFLEHSI